MPGYAEVSLNAMVDVVKNAANRISFHTADSATGANEVAGTATTRPATTWGATAAGDTVGSEVVQTIPAGTTVTHWGLWTADVTPVFRGIWPLLDAAGAPTSEAFTNEGTIKHTPTLDIDNG